MTRYWIDTDPGVDDALAIVLAIKEVGHELVGLSSVQGNVSEPLAATNLLQVLGRCQDAGLTPGGWSPRLVRGSRLPLAHGRAVRAEWVHGESGLGGLAWRARAPLDRWDPTPAHVAIVEAAREAPDLHLVFIGPLTNLALALHVEPDLPRMVQALTVMGGSLRVGGNASLAAEFNFLADPEAARAVLEAGFQPLHLVPIDGCLASAVSEAAVERIRAIGSPASTVACEVLDAWAERIRGGNQALYDPMAWLTVAAPQIATWEMVYAAVDIGEDLARGASLADWMGRTGKAPNVRVAMDADAGAVLDRLCTLLM